MDFPDQRDIDARILAFYGEQFDEHARLTTRSAQGLLEFRRTQEIICEYVPTGRVVGVEGPAGLILEVVGEAGDDVGEAAYLIARTASDVLGLRDFSAHLLAVASA